jgi:hypothetical protein
VSAARAGLVAGLALAAKKLASFERSGFDPEPYLERLAVSALWLFGGADRNVPPDRRPRPGSAATSETCPKRTVV